VGVFKSFRSESITKYTLTFGLLVAVPFKVFPFRVYATGLAFLPLLEATAGTDFLESRVGRSAIVPEFQ
jgi:hypothetical protein